MKPQNPPRRHHSVPYFYLNYFSEKIDGKEGIWVYDKKTLKFQHQHLLNTSVQKDLYTVPTTTDPKDISLELALAQDEAKAKEILDRLVPAEKPIQLTNKEIQILAAFMAIAHVRVPRHIASTKEFTEKHFMETLKAENIEKTKKSLEEYNKRNPKSGTLTLDEYIRLRDRLGKDLHMEMNKNHAMLQSFLNMKDIYLELLKFDWIILHAPKNELFITCDAPLTVFVPIGNGQALFGAGFGRPQAEISFPISPKKSIFLSRKKMPDNGFIYPYFLHELNRRCANMAYRFIYSSFKSDKVLEITKEFSKTIGKNFINQEVVAEEIQKAKKPGPPPPRG